MLDKLKRLAAREPVRMYVYGVLEAIAVLLVGTGALSSDVSHLALGVAVAVLAVPVTEVTRNKVSPVDNSTTDE